MCFTVAIDLVREELEKTFNVAFPREVPFDPAYYFNAFDHPFLPVITSEEPENVTLSQWGLVPQWVRDRQQADTIRKKTINARAETVTQKPSYHHLAGRRHCLLPVTGFYEWHDHHGKKIPYFLRLQEGEPFVLAGLYDLWTDRDTGEQIHTFTLLTLPANVLLARIHNTRKRMPLMMQRREGERWLSADALSLLREAGKIVIPPEKMEYFPLAPDLKHRGRIPDDPTLLEPYDYGFDPLGARLF
jgi:putative SOS response-associated peptidase YedK